MDDDSGGGGRATVFFEPHDVEGSVLCQQGAAISASAKEFAEVGTGLRRSHTLALDGVQAAVFPVLRRRRRPHAERPRLPRARRAAGPEELTGLAAAQRRHQRQSRLMTRRRRYPTATAAALALVLVACSPTTESPVTDQPSAEVKAQTKTNAQLMARRLSTQARELRAETTVCSDDPDADSPISYIYQAGVRLDRGQPDATVDRVVQQFESEGWTSGVNGTYRNLDRDDYRISLQIDDEAPDVALMISSSPCVDETDPD